MHHTQAGLQTGIFPLGDKCLPLLQVGRPQYTGAAAVAAHSPGPGTPAGGESRRRLRAFRTCPFPQLCRVPQVQSGPNEEIRAPASRSALTAAP